MPIELFVQITKSDNNTYVNTCQGSVIKVPSTPRRYLFLPFFRVSVSHNSFRGRKSSMHKRKGFTGLEQWISLIGIDHNIQKTDFYGEG